MFTKIMKWLSVALLLLAVLRLPTAGYQMLLEVIVCFTALLVIRQALRSGKYIWAAGFVAIAVLFNPVWPLAFSHKTFFWLESVCLLTFLVSLAILQRQPRLSMPSITNRTPGSESL